MKKLCSVEGCGRWHYAKGYCDFHLKDYSQWVGKSCVVEGCYRWSERKGGYCELHFYRMKKFGTTELPIKAPTLTLNGSGYYIYREKKTKKIRYEHIRIAEKALGRSLPKGAEVHHVDGNRSNNSPSNLVICPNRAYHSLLERRTKAYANTKPD